MATTRTAMPPAHVLVGAGAGKLAASQQQGYGAAPRRAPRKPPVPAQDSAPAPPGSPRSDHSGLREGKHAEQDAPAYTSRPRAGRSPQSSSAISSRPAFSLNTNSNRLPTSFDGYKDPAEDGPARRSASPNFRQRMAARGDTAGVAPPPTGASTSTHGSSRRALPSSGAPSQARAQPSRRAANVDEEDDFFAEEAEPLSPLQARYSTTAPNPSGRRMTQHRLQPVAAAAQPPSTSGNGRAPARSSPPRTQSPARSGSRPRQYHAGPARTTKATYHEAIFQYQIRMWRMSKAIELAQAKQAQLTAGAAAAHDTVNALRKVQLALNSKRAAAEGQNEVATKDLDEARANLRQVQADKARLLERKDELKKALVAAQKEQDSAQAEAAAILAQRQTRMGERENAIASRQRKLRGELARLQQQDAHVRSENVRKGKEANIVHDMLVSAHRMSRSKSLASEGKLEEACVLAKRAQLAKGREARAKVSLEQSRLREQREQRNLIQAQAAEVRRALQALAVRTQSAAVQKAMLRVAPLARPAARAAQSTVHMSSGHHRFDSTGSSFGSA